MTTRKELAAKNKELMQQLAAHAGNTRKTLNARVATTEQLCKKLTEALETEKQAHATTASRLTGRIAQLEADVAALTTEIAG